MSSLEPRSEKKLNLPQFKSTNMMPNFHRKTTTPRKIKSHLSGFLTPSDKHSIELETHIESSKALLETALPEIPSKKSGQKRSGMLEMWLDEALDPQ